VVSDDPETRIRGFSGTGLNSPGGTRHHAHDDTDTQRQPLSGGAFLWIKKARMVRCGQQGINNKT
ncbi:hypothetical protein ACP1O4_004927, partial [Escherichia coli]